MSHLKVDVLYSTHVRAASSQNYILSFAHYLRVYFASRSTNPSEFKKGPESTKRRGDRKMWRNDDDVVNAITYGLLEHDHNEGLSTEEDLFSSWRTTRRYPWLFSRAPFCGTIDCCFPTKHGNELRSTTRQY